jgi:hypothetical protein
MIQFKLVKVSDNSPEVLTEVELTEDELNVIYSAMDDYKNYGGEDEELAFTVQEKLYELFQE